MKDANILVGYVEKFDFKDPKQAAALSGHPTVGRIYRVFETDGNYLLHIGAANTAGHLEGIALGEQLSGNYDDKWDFIVTPINTENYLNYNIHEEDLAQLLEWFESDHSELKRLLGLPIRAVDINEPNPPIEAKMPSQKDLARISAILAKAGDEDARENRIRIVQEISGSLNYLFDTDPTLVECLNDLFGYLAATYTDKYEDGSVPNISKDIQFSPELGKGANMYSAVKNIQKYSTVGYEGSGSPIALLAAIHYCLFELQRRKIHE